MNTAEINTARQENKTVLNFIKEWQSKNPYNAINRIEVNEHNAKWKVEFSEFLSKGNFSKDTLDLFKD